jgi:hypothetical protein
LAICSLIFIEAMNRLFKSRKSKKAGKPEVQNAGHPLDDPTAPPVTSETPADPTGTLKAPELSRPQNPGVDTSIGGKTSTILSNSFAQARSSPSSLPIPEAQAKQLWPGTGTEAASQQTQNISTSQRLWNDAYDDLQNDTETVKLVKAYVKTLTVVLKAENTPDTSDPRSDNVSFELSDPAKRQIHIKRLLEDGLAKVSKASNITKGVGDVAQFILLAKGMVDLAVQNIPQAALPWAGVCLGLQVSTPFTSRKLFSS